MQIIEEVAAARQTERGTAPTTSVRNRMEDRKKEDYALADPTSWFPQSLIRFPWTSFALPPLALLMTASPPHRRLYDSKSIFEDQLEAIEESLEAPR